VISWFSQSLLSQIHNLWRYCAVRCKLTSPEDRAALKDVADFVTEQDPARDCTAHWWYQRLGGKVGAAFSHVMQCDPMLGRAAHVFLFLTDELFVSFS
jgi:hypothetical protein